MSTITTKPPQVAPPAAPSIPPLQNGDRLTRDEFMRRYEAMPRVQGAELIEGVVYMPSPVRQDRHGMQYSHLNGWLTLYRAATPGVETGADSSLLLDGKNMPQPDALLYILSEHGGRTHINEDGYIVGGPEWIGEISASTVSVDLHDKLDAYRRNGVKEYVVWRVEDRAIDWFVLRGEDFVRMAPSVDGFFKSTVFPGLWLDPQALMNGDLRHVFEVVQMGLQTAEHGEFLKALANSRSSKQS